MIELRTEGRKTFFVGDTYPIRDKLSRFGCRFDNVKRMWWIHDQDVAVEILRDLRLPVQFAQSNEVQKIVDDTIIAGRVVYKGKMYFLAGFVRRGRMHRGDKVIPVETRDRNKFLLVYQDGTEKFWVRKEFVTVIKLYTKMVLLGEIKEARKTLHSESGEFDAYF